MGEIRRRLWDLVLRVERQTAQLLHWSGWRRWHQAWAAWHHTRRRAAALPTGRDGASPLAPDRDATAAEPDARPTPADAAETVAQVWARVQPLLPTSRRSGHPIVYDRRQILAAMVYVMQTDCGWSNLPSHVPPWKTVHAHYVTWRKSGIWAQIWLGLRFPGARPFEQLQL